MGSFCFLDQWSIKKSSTHHGITQKAFANQIPTMVGMVVWGQFAVDIMDHIVNCSLTKILDYFHHFNSRRCNCFSFIRYYLSSSNLFHIMTGRNQNCRGGAYCPVVLLNSTTKLWTCDCNFGCQAKMYFFMKEMASTKPSKPTDDDELVVRQHPTGDR